MSVRIEVEMRRDPIVQLVTFATENMSRAQDLCYLSGLTRAKVDRGFRFSWWDVEHLPYYAEHKALFDAVRGPSYWAWKPALINKVMGPDSFVYDVLDGDVICYADAGIEFIAPVQHIIDRMDWYGKPQNDVWLFSNNWEHAHWCKRDVVASVWPASWNLDGNKPHYSYPVPNGAIAYDKLDGGVSWAMFGKQAQASVIFFRVSDYSRAFVAEWLKWCLYDGGRLIDDSPSRAPNHPEFREHRHDQSILTTLSYREGLRLHWWPAIYNRFTGGPIFTYEKGEHVDTYPPLFHHHRLRNSEWSIPNRSE